MKRVWAELGRGGAPVMLSAAVLAILYAVAIAAPWVAPYDPARQDRHLAYAPPSPIGIRAPWPWNESLLYTHPLRIADPARRRYAADTSQRVPIRFFHRGRLFTTPAGAPRFFLCGTDDLGRDVFSRLVYGARVSLFIGVAGAALSLFIGLLVGSAAGYFGGWIDDLAMRVVEIEMAIPSFYLLLAVAGILPGQLSPAASFFLIVGIMSLVRWAGFARIIRGMAAALREADYVQAARALGASHTRIIARHIIPGTFDYTLIAATLAIPSFILAESALSLLGLGIQEPGASWGNMLAAGQNVQVFVRHPWMLIPGALIFMTVMAFNFLGDHLRDMLDPHLAGRPEGVATGQE